MHFDDGLLDLPIRPGVTEDSPRLDSLALQLVPGEMCFRRAAASL